MRVAQEHHLVNAARTVKKKKEDCILDIRETQWQKIGGVWKSSEGWSPKDPESAIKIEKWVEEITRIIPRTGPPKKHLDPDSLDHQLSAVEGHKKIEIKETKHNWKEAEIEEPKETPRIGEEIEREPWVPRAKIEVALLLGAIIVGFFTYANRTTAPTEDKLFIQEELTRMEEGPWSNAEFIPAIGQINLYNTQWPTSKLEKDEVKRASINIMSQYKTGKLEKVNLTEKEQRQRIEDINKYKRPMLIIKPEDEKNTKLWVSRTGSIIKEYKETKEELSWEFLKSPTIIDLPFLKRTD